MSMHLDPLVILEVEVFIEKDFPTDYSAALEEFAYCITLAQFWHSEALGWARNGQHCHVGFLIKNLKLLLLAHGRVRQLGLALPDELLAQDETCKDVVTFWGLCDWTVCTWVTAEVKLLREKGSITDEELEELRQEYFKVEQECDWIMGYVQ